MFIVKRKYAQRYIYIFLILFLFLRISQKLHITPIFGEEEATSFDYIVLDHPENCHYNSLFGGFQITRCEAISLGSVIRVIGRESGGSDNDFFSKKKLAVQSINDCGASADSVICWFEDGLTAIIRHKQRFLEYVIGHMKSADFSFLRSLMFAESAQLSNSAYLILETIGMLHILSASGLHVGIVSETVEKLISWMPKHIQLFLLALTLFSFAVMAGLRASVIRATTMVVVREVARVVFRKRVHLLWLLVVTVYLILVIEPRYLLSASFQLSVVASFSVIAWVSFFASAQTRSSTLIHLIANDSRISSSIPQYRKSSLMMSGMTAVVSYLKNALTISVVVQLGLLPLLFQYFGFLTLVGLLANPLLLWLVPPLVSFGLMLFASEIILRDAFDGVIVSGLAIFFSLFSSLFMSIAEFLSSLSLTVLRVEYLPIKYVFYWYTATLLILILYIGRRKRNRVMRNIVNFVVF